MNHDRYEDTYIRGILDEVKTIAVVGASANTVRPSYFVLKYLISKGYDVIPVNPGHAGREIAGCMTFASLGDIDRPVDMVDIFRNSEAAKGVVEEALALEPLPKVIWMQLSVRNDEAAAMAEAKGVKVVMNRCPKIEYARLCGEIGWAGVASNVISARKPKLQQGFQRFAITRQEKS
ncbi:CoA-binding protein [Salaquimonas pukyongi]|uniref:CoA-binding protein n=1 Tax=Salaquimonas pukyongi TaxID=2712698 RepID=UPI00096BC0AE|nr:CoA-binding protein [Salaquimonas pukyongi]